MTGRRSRLEPSPSLALLARGTPGRRSSPENRERGALAGLSPGDWRASAPDSPRVPTWEVVEITPERVEMRDSRTGGTVPMDREAVEAGLAIGRYSTNLTDFEWVSVYQVGRWGGDLDVDESGTRRTGRPYVSIVAYGDDGRTYGRSYRFVDPESRALGLWKEDRLLDGFPDGVVERLDERVRAALDADGSAVTERGVAEA